MKDDWRRYIYLWVMYALFEETEMGDIERTREVWKACLEIIPHKKLTFAKIWIYFAHFEIRQKNLSEARKILGAGIGRAPKDKLFRKGLKMLHGFGSVDGAIQHSRVQKPRHRKAGIVPHP